MVKAIIRAGLMLIKLLDQQLEKCENNKHTNKTNYQSKNYLLIHVLNTKPRFIEQYRHLGAKFIILHLPLNMNYKWINTII